MKAINMDKQKYALVTGSTKGIGKQIVIDLLKKDYFVILNYANDEGIIEELKSELYAISDKFKIIQEDLSNMDNIPAFVEKVKNDVPYLDALILNAGATDRKPFNDLSFESWTNVLNANLNCPFFIVQGLANYIVDSGNIIFISSIMGIYPHSLSISYGVSKSAINTLAQYLVKYFAERKITVNTIAPGFVETSWQKNKPEEIKNNIIEKTALKRFATTEEISSTCLHLIDNKFINGQTIVVDGGYCYC